MSAPDHELRRPDQSLGDLVDELTDEFSVLVRTHVDLARSEIRRDVVEAARAATLGAGAAVAGLLALVILSSAAAWGLAETMAAGWAFLIVGLVWTVVAAGLAMAARQRAAEIEPGPQETMAEIQEDREWLKNRTS